MGQNSFLKVAAVLLVSGAMALAAPTVSPGPGSLNYIEGLVSVNGQTVNPNSVGSVTVQPGDTISTGNGKVEMLLTPGVFLRVGDNSRLQVISSGLADIRLGLMQGQATIEADDLVKDNHLTVEQGPVATRILKKGFYVLNANEPYVQVLDGKAEVMMNGDHKDAGKGREVVMNSKGKLKDQDFRMQTADDESLVRWSRLRSAYEAQANMDEANAVAANNNWAGPGWYWDAGYGFWSYLPADGILYSPWGWGFYSPWYAPVYLGGYYGPYYGGIYRGGIYRGNRGFRGGVGGGFRGGAGGGFRGGRMAGGLRAGGMRMGAGGGHVGGHGGGRR